MALRKHVLRIQARQILDSRGQPTVEVEFITVAGPIRASAPAGKSVGSQEMPFLRDASPSFGNLSVFETVGRINSEAAELLSTQFSSQKDFDTFLYEANERKMAGSGFTLPLSICFCKLSSIINSQEYYENIYGLIKANKSKASIPLLNYNVINGGVHSGNNLECQEVMIAFSPSSVPESLEKATVFYSALRSEIAEKYGSLYTGVGDEGGFAPPISSISEAIELLTGTAKKCSVTDYKLALDFAANSFWKEGRYILEGMTLTSKEMVAYYTKLLKDYPCIYSIEDPFHEKDFTAWKALTAAAGSELNIVADDLVVTNPELISRNQGLFNTVLIKPNQIGTVSGAIEAVEAARRSNCKVMVSHRSAETEDVFIAGFAVGVIAEYAKFGAPSRGERIAKYNELLRIEEKLMLSDQK